MRIKTQAKVEGVPEATIALAAEQPPNSKAQIAMFVTAIDAFGIGTVVAWLRMSADEARALCDQLERAADSADDLDCEVE